MFGEKATAYRASRAKFVTAKKFPVVRVELHSESNRFLFEPLPRFVGQEETKLPTTHWV